MKIRPLVLAIVSLSGTASVSAEFAGSYRADQRLVNIGATLRYDLDLHPSGRAELRVSASGSRVSPRDNDIRQFGTVLEVLERDRRSVHSGSWRFERDRVRVSLTNRNGRSVSSTFEFREGFGGLSPTRWDNHNYGSRSLSFSRTRSAPSVGSGGWGWQGSTGSDDAFRGTWESRVHIGFGRGDLTRRIVLDRGGRARVEWSRSGGSEVRFERQDLDRFGHLLLLLERNRSIRHEGRFEHRGSSVVLRLDRAGREWVTSTLEFRIERDGLRMVSGDRRNYGSERFTARER